ncbi:unnamed protein product, partial [Prorocentrum cordatum]
RRRPRPRRRQAACSCPGPQDPEGRRGRHGGGARASLAAAGHAGQAPGPDVRHLDAREGRGRGSRGRRAHARLVLQVCGEGAGGGPGRGGGRGRAGGRRRRRGGGRGAGRDGLRGASPRPPSLTTCGLHVSGARLGSARAPRRAPSLRSRAVLARSPCTETSTRAPAGSLGPPEAAEAAGARGPREEPGPAPACPRHTRGRSRGGDARGSGPWCRGRPSVSLGGTLWPCPPAPRGGGPRAAIPTGKYGRRALRVVPTRLRPLRGRPRSRSPPVARASAKRGHDRDRAAGTPAVVDGGATPAASRARARVATARACGVGARSWTAERPTRRPAPRPGSPRREPAAWGRFLREGAPRGALYPRGRAATGSRPGLQTAKAWARTWPPLVVRPARSPRAALGP